MNLRCLPAKSLMTVETRRNTRFSWHPVFQECDQLPEDRIHPGGARAASLSSFQTGFRSPVSRAFSPDGIAGPTSRPAGVWDRFRVWPLLPDAPAPGFRRRTDPSVPGPPIGIADSFWPFQETYHLSGSRRRSPERDRVAIDAPDRRAFSGARATKL